MRAGMRGELNKLINTMDEKTHAIMSARGKTTQKRCNVLSRDH